MVKKTHYIYGLIDPDSREIRYVGRSTNLTQRYKDHCGDRNEGTDSYRAWQKGLLADGKKPELVIFKTCTSQEEAKLSERFFVLLHFIQGGQLTNRMECIKDGHLIRKAVSCNDAQSAYDLMGLPWDIDRGCLTDRRFSAYEIEQIKERYQLTPTN